MILLKSTDTLQVLLAGAVAANQAALYAAYADMANDGSTFAPGNSNGTTNSATAVAWVAAPSSGNVRQVKYLSLYNADTASITATVQINDGTNTRILVKFQLQAGERVAYLDGHGFNVFASDGSVKQSAVTSVNSKSGVVVLGSADIGVNVQAVVSAATVTPLSTNDFIDVTAQAAALAIANPTGAMVNGWGLGFRIKDNGTAQAITWGTKYRGIGGALPTTTVAGKRMIFGGVYNSTDDKVDVILPVAQES